MTKSEFVRDISRGVIRFGFCRSPATAKGTIATFVAPVGDTLVLSLGVESSARYKERFTGSYYLSRSFIWGYVLPGFPKDAYIRVGHLLSSEERAHFLDSQWNAAGVIDAWWSGYSPTSVARFLSAISATMPRITENLKLRKEVEACASLTQHVDIVRHVGQSLDEAVPLEGKKPPSQFLFAARAAINALSAPYRSRAYVELVARDAWLRAIGNRKGWGLE
jgi:hypothetical protein